MPSLQIGGEVTLRGGELTAAAHSWSRGGLSQGCERQSPVQEGGRKRRALHVPWDRRARVLTTLAFDLCQGQGVYGRGSPLLAYPIGPSLVGFSTVTW